MNTFKRIITLSLAMIMLASTCLTAASCKKKGAVKKTVSESDPWYTTKRVELDPKFSEEDYLYVYPEGPWLCNDRYIMHYKVDDYPNEERAYSRDFDLMGIFDLEGNLLSLVNLSEIMREFESPYAPSSYITLCEGNEGIRFYFQAIVMEEEWDTSDGSPGKTYASHTKVFSCEFDSDSGEVVVPGHGVDIKPANSSSFWFYNMNVIEGYEVCSVVRNEDGTNILVVCQDGKTLYDVDFNEAFGPGVFQAVVNTYGVGNGKVIVEGRGKTPLVAELDLQTGTVTRVTDGKPLSHNQKFSATNEGKGYLTKATGIYEYDVTGANENCALNFDYCDVNRFESQNAAVLAVEDNKVVLGCAAQFEGYMMPDPAVVYVLEKAEKNPNAGKALLTVASLSDSVSYFEAEALKKFNEQNQDYHVQLVLYDQRDYQSAGDATEDMDTTDRQMYNALSMVSGSLTMDIRSGNGPDVILGAAQCIDVLDSQYLMDLTPYLQGSTYDASAYYSDIIEASKLDGKAYFVPTAFSIAGILTDASLVAPDQVGFTYEQYISFVQDQFGGADKVTEFISRLHFLNICFERSYDKWTQDKSMDLNSEEFRELVTFFKDQIPEGVTAAPENQYDWIDPLEGDEQIFDVVFLENIQQLMDLAQNNYFGKNMKILGLPSKDGTGPSANITNSFSITAGTAVKEGAYALLDILLSEEVQKGATEAYPINRAAAAYRVDRQRQINENKYGWFQQPGQLKSPTIYRCASTYVPDTKLDEILLQTFENVDTVLLSDNAVMMIVDEEIPAYLLGQKDLDTVIATINDRAKNVFSER